MATLNNQSLIDVTLQEYGSLEALVEVAMNNGKSVTSDLQIGEILQIGEPVNKDVTQYFKENNLKVVGGTSYPASFDFGFDFGFDS